jgi:transcriptional regulator with XRE-family HTH domain
MQQARELIRRAIQELGISQNEAERRAGLHVGQLSAVLGGKGVSVATAIRLRDALGVPVEAWLSDAQRSKLPSRLRKRSGRRETRAS